MSGRWQALLQERADLVAEGERILGASEREGRSLSADERARDDAINARLAEISADLAREEQRRERLRTVQAGGVDLTANAHVHGAAGYGPEVRRTAAGVVDASGNPVAQTTIRIGSHAASFPRLIPVVSDDAWGRVENGRPLAALKPWGSDTGAPFGEFLVAVAKSRMGMSHDPRLNYTAAAQGAGENTPADGGFLVQQEVNTAIVMLMHQMGRIMSQVDKIPLGPNSNGLTLTAIKETSRATGSRWGGVQGYWADEGGAGTATRPKFRRVAMLLRKLIALGYASDELLNDAVALEAVMTKAFAEELLFLTEDAIIRGTGAGQPLGILNAAATVSVSKETGQAAATIVASNLSKMWARLDAGSQATAQWYINVDCQPQLDELFLPAGTAGLEPRFVSYGQDGILRIKGRPVVPIEYCATLGTVGDIILADFDDYALIERGPEQASSIHVAFTTDETAFRATYRVDGQPKLESAVTPYKGSNTLSPFVTLATRA
jgi:HK97 family phage major capsid protein